MSKFSVEKYQIYFSSVQTKDEIKEAFKKFLKTEMNSEPFDCIEDIIKFKILPENEKNQLFIEIIEKYVLDTSPCQVNISNKDKEPLLNLYRYSNQGKLDEKFKELLNLKIVLENELHFDNFPRFIRSKENISLFQKYKDDLSVMTPYISIRFPYSDDHFNDLISTETDFDFVNELSNDSFEWEHAHGSKNINVYYSTTDFFPNSKYFKGSICIKGVAILPININKLITNLEDANPLDALGVKRTDYKTIYHSQDELKKMYPDASITGPCLEVTETIVLPFPFNTPRKMITCGTMTYLENEEVYLILIKPYLGKLDIKDKNIDWEQKNPLKNGFEGYYIPALHFIKIKKINDSTTQITHLRVSNMRGYMLHGKQIISLMIKVVFGALESRMKKVREKFEDHTREDLEKRDTPLSKLILDNLPKNFDQSPLRKNSFDFHGLYRINFESIYLQKNIHESFNEFLIKEKYYGLEFIDELSKIKSSSFKEQNSKFIMIVENYFQDSSDKKINIPKKDQETLLDILKNIKDSKVENPYDSLNDIKIIIENQLKMEYFPRFIRLKEYQVLFNRHSFEQKVLVSMDPIDFLVEDSYFNKLTVTQKEIDFIFRLEQDNYDWNHVLSDKGMNIFSTKQNYLPNSKFFKNCGIVKGELIYDFNIFSSLSVLTMEILSKQFSPKDDYKTNFYSKETLKKMYPDEEIFGSCFEYEHSVQIPILMSKARKLILSVHFIYVKNQNAYLFIAKPYFGKLNLKDQEIDWTKSLKLNDSNFEGYYAAQLHYSIYRPVGNNLTHATHIKLFDMRGLLSSTKALVPLMLKVMFPSFKNMINKKIEEKKETNSESLKESKDPIQSLVYEIIKEEFHEMK